MRSGVMGVPVIAVYYDDKDMGHVSKYVSESIRAPHPEDQKTSSSSSWWTARLASRAASWCRHPTRHSRRSRDTRACWSATTSLACTDWEITKLFVDKKYTYALAEQAGVPAPKTAVPHSIEDVERYAQTVQYPCLVKPSQGHQYFEVFRRKMVKADDLDQMLAAYREATDAGFEVMLQEFIPGDSAQGVNYNSYSWGGETLVEFTAAKIRNAPRDTGSPCCNMSAHVPEVIEPGRRILQAMGFDGYACTEFKRDPRDGVYKLMEVNGRHNLSSLLAVRCGINFPWIHYEHLVHGKLPSACRLSRRACTGSTSSGTSACSPGIFSRERYSLMQYLKPYFSPHVFAIPDCTRPEAVPQAGAVAWPRRPFGGPAHPKRAGSVAVSRTDQSTTFRGLRSPAPPEPFLKHRTGSAAHRGEKSV